MKKKITITLLSVLMTIVCAVAVFSIYEGVANSRGPIAALKSYFTTEAEVKPPQDPIEDNTTPQDPTPDVPVEPEGYSFGVWYTDAYSPIRVYEFDGDYLIDTRAVVASDGVLEILRSRDYICRTKIIENNETVDIYYLKDDDQTLRYYFKKSTETMFAIINNEEVELSRLEDYRIHEHVITVESYQEATDLEFGFEEVNCSVCNSYGGYNQFYPKLFNKVYAADEVDGIYSVYAFILPSDFDENFIAFGDKLDVYVGEAQIIGDTLHLLEGTESIFECSGDGYGLISIPATGVSYYAIDYNLGKLICGDDASVELYELTGFNQIVTD